MKAANFGTRRSLYRLNQGLKPDGFKLRFNSKANFETVFLDFIGSRVETRRFQALWVSWIQLVQPHHREDVHHLPQRTYGTHVTVTNGSHRHEDEPNGVRNAVKRRLRIRPALQLDADA